MTHDTKKILFCGVPLRGHRNELLPTAKALQERGHEILWMEVDGTPEGTKEFSENSGVTVIPVEANHYRKALFAEMIAYKSAEDRKTLMRKIFFEHEVEPFLEIAEPFAPDIIVMDGLQYMAPVIAHRLGIAYVVLSRTLAALAPPDVPCDRQNYSIDKRYFYLKHETPCPETKNWNVISPYLNIIGITKELVPGAEIAANTELVGPFEVPVPPVDFPWDSLDPAKKKIYIGLGNTFPKLEIFHRFLKACDESEYQVIASFPEPEKLAKVTSNSLIFPFVPQVELLKRVDLFVTHCGAGLTEAIPAGVPMLLVPWASDMPVNAHFMAKSGLGIQVSPDAEIETIRDAVSALLAPSPYTEKAKRIAESLRDNDAAGRAAELVLGLA